MTNRESVDEARTARGRAFVEWFQAQHAAEIEAAAVAVLCGQAVRMAYDRDARRVRMTPVEARER